MTDYRFSLILPMKPLAHDEVLAVTDSLGAAGCTDASIRGHSIGLELLFERSGESLQSAISSAIGAVEKCGYRVGRVEMEREAISV